MKRGITKLLTTMLACIMAFSVSTAAFADTKADEKAQEEYYKALAQQQGTVLPVSINVTVKNKKHNVGDTLSAKDFTVTVNMSDGSKVKNPAGWTANPLVLSSESTEITVAYNGLSTKITVKANPAAVQQQPTRAQQPEAQQTKKWPASAYEPVNKKAYNDIYDYAYAHGYVEKCDSKTGYDIWYMSKDNDDSCIFVVLTDKGWLASYWKSKSSGGSYHEEFLGTATLEHVYDYMF